MLAPSPPGEGGGYQSSFISLDVTPTEERLNSGKEGRPSHPLASLWTLLPPILEGFI